MNRYVKVNKLCAIRSTFLGHGCWIFAVQVAEDRCLLDGGRRASREDYRRCFVARHVEAAKIANEGVNLGEDI